MSKKKIIIISIIIICIVIITIIIINSLAAAKEKKAAQEAFYDTYDSYKLSVINLIESYIKNSSNDVLCVEVKPDFDISSKTVKGYTFYDFDEVLKINVQVKDIFDSHGFAVKYENAKKFYDCVKPSVEEAKDTSGLSGYLNYINETYLFKDIFDAEDFRVASSFDVVVRTNENEYEYSPFDGNDYLRINDVEYYGDKFINGMAGRDAYAPIPYDELTYESKKRIVDWIYSQYKYYDEKDGRDTGDKYSDVIFREASDKYQLTNEQLMDIWANIH